MTQYATQFSSSQDVLKVDPHLSVHYQAYAVLKQKELRYAAAQLRGEIKRREREAPSRKYVWDADAGVVNLLTQHISFKPELLQAVRIEEARRRDAEQANRPRRVNLLTQQVYVYTNQNVDMVADEMLIRYASGEPVKFSPAYAISRQRIHHPEPRQFETPEEQQKYIARTAADCVKGNTKEAHPKSFNLPYSVVKKEVLKEEAKGGAVFFGKLIEDAAPRSKSKPASLLLFGHGSTAKASSVAEALTHLDEATRKIVTTTVRRLRAVGYHVHLRREPLHGELAVLLCKPDCEVKTSVQAWFNQLQACVERGCGVYTLPHSSFKANALTNLMPRMGKFVRAERDGVVLLRWEPKKYTFRELAEYELRLGKKQILWRPRELRDLFCFRDVPDKRTGEVRTRTVRVFPDPAAYFATDLAFPLEVELRDSPDPNSPAAPLRLLTLSRADWLIGGPQFYDEYWLAGKKVRWAHQSKYMMDLDLDGSRLSVSRSRKEPGMVQEIRLYGPLLHRLTQWMKCKENQTDVKGRWEHQELFTHEGDVPGELPPHLTGIPVWLAVLDENGRGTKDNDPRPKDWVFGCSNDLENLMDEDDYVRTRGSRSTQEWIEAINFDREEYELAAEDSLDWKPPAPPCFNADVFYEEYADKSRAWFYERIVEHEGALVGLRQRWKRAVTPEAKAHVKALANVHTESVEAFNACLRKIDEGTYRKCETWRRWAKEKAERLAWQKLLELVQLVERYDTGFISDKPLLDVAWAHRMPSLYTVADLMERLQTDNRKWTREEREEQQAVRTKLRRAATLLRNKTEPQLVAIGEHLDRAVDQIEGLDALPKTIQALGKDWYAWVEKKRPREVFVRHDGEDVPLYSYEQRKVQDGADLDGRVRYKDRPLITDESGIEWLRRLYAQTVALVGGANEHDAALEAIREGEKDCFAMELANTILYDHEGGEDRPKTDDEIADDIYAAAIADPDTLSRAFDLSPALRDHEPGDLGEAVAEAWNALHEPAPVTKSGKPRKPRKKGGGRFIGEVVQEAPEYTFEQAFTELMEEFSTR